MIEQQKIFPKLKGFNYNAHQKVNGDKIFLHATKDINNGEEIYFDYSFDYWKWFYDYQKKFEK